MEPFTSLTVVDMTILGTLLIACIVGWATGIIRFLTGFFAFVAAVAVAGRYSQAVMRWLNDSWQVQERLEKAIQSRLALPPEAAAVPTGQVSAETAITWLKAVPIPQFYKLPLAEQTEAWSASAGGKTAAEFLGEQIAAGILNAIVFVVLATLLSVLISYLGRLVSDQIHEIPLIGTVDRLLGAGALVLETALILSFVTVWVVPMLSMMGAEELGRAFDQAKTAAYLVSFFEWVRAFLFGGGTRLWNG